MNNQDASGLERPEQEEPKRAEDEAATSQPIGSRRADHFAERARYAYLFHLWAEPRRDGKKPIWRFSLEEVDTGVRHGFGNFDALVEFLQQRMATD